MLIEAFEDHFGSSVTEKRAHHGKEFIEGGRCTYTFSLYSAPTVDWCGVARAIDMIPDVALLQLFDF
jgi:hypothetical protein